MVLDRPCNDLIDIIRGDTAIEEVVGLDEDDRRLCAQADTAGLDNGDPVGELQGIEHDIIEFALDQLRTPRLKEAKFVIEAIPAKFRCRVCAREWGLEREKLDEATGEAIHFVPEIAHVYLKCPSCGSPDFEITEGRGVWLASIRGRKKE